METNTDSRERLMYKALNKLVTGPDFEDKDTDNYIYASLSQPPLKVVDKHDSLNVFDWDVICPTCKATVNYGEEIFMLSGHMYCINKGCRDNLVHQLGKEN